METKICTSCKTEKSNDLFYKSKKGLYGTSSQCKRCEAERKSNYNTNNRAKRNEALRKWRDLNQDLYRAQKKRGDKKYYESHRERINSYIKEWRKNNRKLCAGYQYKWRDKNQLVYSEIQSRYRCRLTDGYVRQKLVAEGWPVTSKTIEAKRTIIKIKRKWKNSQKTSTN